MTHAQKLYRPLSLHNNNSGYCVLSPQHNHEAAIDIAFPAFQAGQRTELKHFCTFKSPWLPAWVVRRWDAAWVQRTCWAICGGACALPGMLGTLGDHIRIKLGLL